MFSSCSLLCHKTSPVLRGELLFSASVLTGPAGHSLISDARGAVPMHREDLVRSFSDKGGGVATLPERLTERRDLGLHVQHFCE